MPEPMTDASDLPRVTDAEAAWWDATLQPDTIEKVLPGIGEIVPAFIRRLLRDRERLTEERDAAMTEGGLAEAALHNTRLDLKDAQEPRTTPDVAAKLRAKARSVASDLTLADERYAEALAAMALAYEALVARADWLGPHGDDLDGVWRHSECAGCRAVAAIERLAEGGRDGR
jgi:hypothetical protein